MTCQKEDIELSVDVFGQIEFYQRWQKDEVLSLLTFSWKGCMENCKIA